MARYLLPLVLLLALVLGLLVDLGVVSGWYSFPVAVLVVYLLGAVEGVGFVSRERASVRGGLHRRRP